MSILSAGSVVAGYRIERVLGSGGMGVVYLAANPNLPRYDALKVLNPQLSGNPEFRDRFIREADVAARLDHPNVVSIYDRGQTHEGQLWIAMQFVDGADAEQALRAHPMTPARAVHLVGEVAKALDHAHQQGVLHRDVKPANFLLSGPPGPDERVLLGDFGIARAFGDTALAATGAGMATLSYAAPEMLAGGPIDARADLYSLGCSLFKMLTGKTPFASDGGVAALIGGHLHAPPPRVTDQVPGLSARMDWVIATAMAKDPAQRFSSARQLAAAAAEAINDARLPTTAPWRSGSGVPGSSHPLPPMPPTGQPAPTRTMMVPPVPPGYQMPPLGPGLFPFPPSRRRRRRLVVAALAAAAVVAAVAAITVTLMVRSQPQQAASPSVSITPESSGPPSNSPSTTTAAGPAPPVSVAMLSGFLLTPEQTAAILGVPSMKVSNTSGNGFTDDTPYISAKDCTGPYAPADLGAYGQAGSIGSQLQLLTNPTGPNGIGQAVIAFPSAAAAQKVLADQRQQWSACAGRTFTLTVPDQTPSRWTFGPLSTADGNLVMAFTAESRTSASCQRALTARNNIIIDVAANGFDVGNHGVDILNAIAAKIPQ